MMPAALALRCCGGCKWLSVLFLRCDDAWSFARFPPTPFMLLSAYPPPESPTSSAFCSHVFRLLYPLHHVVMLLYCLAVPVQRAQVAADRRTREGAAEVPLWVGASSLQAQSWPGCQNEDSCHGEGRVPVLAQCA